MKRIFLFIIAVFILFSCNNDDEIIFEADASNVEISFEPFAGGAKMKYKLPDNSEIFGIKASYTTDRGRDITVTGTYLSDNIDLFGFVEGKVDVPVEITLLDHSNNETESITKKFTANPCGAKSFFENFITSAYWNGFMIEYTCPRFANGFYHIGQVAKNASTGEMDTLLLRTRPITPGAGKELFSDVIDPEETSTSTIVVWTEDFKGNLVDKRVYEDVPAAIAVKANSDNFSADGNSIDEDDYDSYGCGSQYLFDGDTKGIEAFKANDRKDRLCASKWGAIGQPFYIDLKEETNLAFLKIYEPLCTDIEHSYNIDWNYTACFPNDIEVYASNDRNAPMEDWELLGNFYEAESTPLSNRWMTRSIDMAYKCNTVEEMEAADPVSCQINFEVSEKTYRYVKVIVKSCFKGMSDWGPLDPSNWIIQELEVYVKKQ